MSNERKPINFAATVAASKFATSFQEGRVHLARVFRNKEELNIHNMKLAEAANESKAYRARREALENESAAFDKAYTANLAKKGIRSFVNEALQRGITADEVRNSDQVISRSDPSREF